MEQWKVVEGFEKYVVSNEGRVMSVWKRKMKLLKPFLTVHGYHSVTFYDGVTNSQQKLHRVVAEAFIPNPDNKPTVNHKDGKPLNNVVTNLEWATMAEQNTHKQDILMKHNRADKSGRRKLTWGEVTEIRQKYSVGGSTMEELAGEFSVTPGNIHRIVHNKGWIT